MNDGLALMDLALPLAVACRGRGGTCGMVIFIPFGVLGRVDALRAVLAELRWSLERARHGDGKNAVDCIEPRCPACIMAASVSPGRRT